MRNRHLTEEEIAIYADALNLEKLEDVSSEIKDHVKECDECADMVLMVADLAKDADGMGIVKSEKKKLGLSFYIRIAASIILILGAGLIYHQLNKSEKGNPKLSETNKQTIKIAVDSVVFTTKKEEPTKDKSQAKKSPAKKLETNGALLAYVEYDDLEKLVDRYKRSALRGDFSTKSESIISLSKGEELILEWNNPGEEELIIEFFNNRGEKLFEGATVEEKYATEDLKNPGLYYWKLINEDFDLLFCGKIIIK